MDAIKLLIQDHQEAKTAMAAVELATGAAKKEQFAAFARLLKVHDRIEENLFYPAVRGFLETAGYAPADRDAHERIEKSLLHLKSLPVGDPHWPDVYDSMRVNLLRHFADEELHLFAKVRSHLDDAKLEELGTRMKLEKDRLMAPV
jgi:hemerythrin superfamily protein